jgi:two-component system NarL family sensor kinase
MARLAPLAHGMSERSPQPQGESPWRLRRKVLLIALLPLLASLLLIALAVRSQAQDLARRERVLVEQAYLQSKETELRNHVAVAMSMVGPIYDSGRDDEAAKAEAARILQSLRYGGGDGYFFAYDYTGVNIVHPLQPEFLGKNLWNVRDSSGRPVVQALIALAKTGGGTYTYAWNKPSAHTETPKMSYVVGLPRWGWMLGTGVYLDDIQATLDQLDRQVATNIWTTMAWIAGIALLGLALVAGTALAMNLSTYREADAQLQLMARQVVRSQEQERAHLSRELHDSTSQTLVSIKLLLESGIAQLGRQGNHPTPTALHRALDRLGDALHEVRNISHRLRPAELDVLGLPAALDQLGQAFGEASGLAVSMRVRGTPLRLPDEVNTVLFRITQECLTNIEKHAQASQVQLRLLFHRGGLRLSVSDDGVGMDIPGMDTDPQRGIGLRNMRERVEAVGGRFRIHSAPGRTQVLADIAASALARFPMAPMATTTTSAPVAHPAP